MHILFLTQYFPPEVGAPQNRLSDLARRLVQAGHYVTVLTALPNYPTGKIFKEYQGRLIVKEESDGVKVIRTWIYASKTKAFVRRLMNYFSFVMSSLIVGMWQVGRQDYIVVESPPLFLGISGFLLSRIKGAKLVFNVSDLWPESAIAMGVLRNKTLIRLSQWLEEFLYRHSHLITGQTQGIVENIHSRCPNKRIALITNGVDTAIFGLKTRPRENRNIKRKFELEEKFVIGYAGLHGLAQGLETVIRTAGILVVQQDLLFAFFGDGPEKEKLQRIVEQAHLTNVRFYPSQPNSLMPEIYSCFDVAIIPLKRLPLFKGALPSKIFEAMAAALPIIGAVEGEARILIEKAQAGVVVEPEDAQAMVEAVLRLHKDSVYRSSLGENGRRYVMEHYDREQIAKKFERLLSESSCSAVHDQVWT